MNIEIDGLALIKHYMAFNDLGIIMVVSGIFLFLGGIIGALCAEEKSGVYISLIVVAIGIIIPICAANLCITVPRYIFGFTGPVDMNHIQLSWYVENITRNLITMIPIEFSPI